MRVCVTCFVAISAAQAQNSGSITGAIIDPNGAMIVHAQITVRGESVLTRTSPNDSGRFRALGLPAGTYVVELSSPGFVTKTIENVRVEEGAETRLPGTSLSVIDFFSGCKPYVPGVIFEPARSRKGEISGTVGGGGWISTGTDALITIRNARTNRLVKSIPTGQAGFFNFPAVRPGKYALTAHQEGYADFVVDSVEVRPGQNTHIVDALPLLPCAIRACAPNHRIPAVCL